LGHGHCETFTKSNSIASPGGGATSDSQIIAEQSWRLLSGFNFDPKELRGIAIQVQKLEAIPKALSAATNYEQIPPIEEAPGGEMGQDADVKVQSLPDSKDDFSGPTSSFLEALPPDIRAEVEAQYKKDKANEELNALDVNTSVHPSKEKATVDTKRMARIIHQLAPRNAGSNPLSKSKKEFFSRRREKLDVTNSSLIKLGIDPEFFWQLSINDQREQLTIFRAKQEQA
jgi:DNA repair protein REV1